MGYIGSHLVKVLIEQQQQVVIVDNLSAGAASVVPGGELIIHHFDDREFLDSLFNKTAFDGPFHFVSQIIVSESVKDLVANTIVRTPPPHSCCWRRCAIIK